MATIKFSRTPSPIFTSGHRRRRTTLIRVSLYALLLHQIQDLKLPTNRDLIFVSGKIVLTGAKGFTLTKQSLRRSKPIWQAIAANRNASAACFSRGHNLLGPSFFYDNGWEYG
ncbi:hypothetical protein L1987_09035 [Smallanthus sonchifolius]|uniref:Uncharacterized protein n=1 Tax=Smallanthus sonchifolius TaxID=185202 RepID=A0ACB9JM95_9ASTR|nr:hypothetical protein L1987_09035 [Smallanthus sonchifolius]